MMAARCSPSKSSSPTSTGDKLGWLNGHYIRSLDSDELADRIVGHLSLTGVLGVEPAATQIELIRAATPLVQERMQLLSESEGMLAFLLVGDADLVIQDDARAQLRDDAASVLDMAIPALDALPNWVAGDIEAALRAVLVDGLGIKPKFAFTPLRVGVTGRRISPPLFESMEILGRDSSLTRLRSLRASL
jgi:glutamyl-tRNA synthetase